MSHEKRRIFPPWYSESRAAATEPQIVSVECAELFGPNAAATCFQMGIYGRENPPYKSQL